MEELLLKTSIVYRQTISKRDLQEELTVCFEQLDFNKLKILIEEEALFEEQSKRLFLEKYKKVFSYIKSKQQVNILYRGKSTCNFCQKGSEVISFSNEQGGIHFGIRFHYECGVLLDILECNSFEGFFRSLIPSQRTAYAVPFVLKDD